MKPQWKIAASLAALSMAGAQAQGVDANAAMALAQKSGCLACHSLDGKMVGPAWKEVG
jgi:cytochrome c